MGHKQITNTRKCLGVKNTFNPIKYVKIMKIIFIYILNFFMYQTYFILAYELFTYVWHILS